VKNPASVTRHRHESAFNLQGYLDGPSLISNTHPTIRSGVATAHTNQ